MPVSWTINPEKRRIEAKVTGDVLLDDVLEAIGRSVLDPAFRPGFDIISDHTDVGEVITTTQVLRAADLLKSLSDYYAGARWAVWTSKPASYGMMRMLSVYVQRVPMELSVFESEDKAEAWLAADPERRCTAPQP